MSREKSARINMSYSQENYDFLKMLSKATGRSLTEIENGILDKFREEHAELAEQSRKTIEAFEKSGFAMKEPKDN